MIIYSMETNINTINHLIHQIMDKYSLHLLNWANKKTNRLEDAEDLVQEVMIQIFLVLQKEHQNGMEIKKIDHFVWKIARYTWFNFLKKNKFANQCVPFDTYLLQQNLTSIPERNSDEDQEAITQIRLQISHLNFIQREAMIMRYIEKLPIKTIAEKLQINVGNVKWHLSEAKEKIKREVSNMSENYDHLYRPRKMYIRAAGISVGCHEIEKINDDLVKQNICLACYDAALTIDELSGLLNIAKAYLEADLGWLIQQEFIKKQANKYLTIFPIETLNLQKQVIAFYYQHKPCFTDQLISQLAQRAGDIQALQYYGSEKPLAKQLWFLIYSFLYKVFVNTDYLLSLYHAQCPIRPDGGKYIPIGIEIPTEKNLFQQICGEQYRLLDHLTITGPMYNVVHDMQLWWHEIYTRRQHRFKDLISGKWHLIDNLFYKILQPSFQLSELSKEEQFTLSEFIRWGWFTQGKKGLIPNFYLLTTSQKEELDQIFQNIQSVMHKEIERFQKDLLQIYKSYYAKQFPKYYQFLCLNAMGKYINISTGFALVDGLLYQPKNADEYALLPFKVIT